MRIDDLRNEFSVLTDLMMREVVGGRLRLCLCGHTLL